MKHVADRLIIKHAAELITCSGFAAKKGNEMSELHIIRDGAVIVEHGVIAVVGKTSDVINPVDEKKSLVIDATGKTVLPGFVDSHTHFVFGGDRALESGWRLAGDSYMEIMQRGGGIAASVKATRALGEQELIEICAQRLDSMLDFGVTTVEGKSGYGLDLETELMQLRVMRELNRIHPVDVVPTYMGAHALPDEFKGQKDAYIDYIIATVLPKIAEEQLAEFCDVFCEQGVFSVTQSRRLLQAAKDFGLKVKIHADEIVGLGGAGLAAELGAVSADHLLMSSDQDLLAMKTSGVTATLLPGTAFSLREPYARARFMIDQGLAVALATDFNPGSCYTESIPLVIALAALQMRMSPAEIITALTINGAAALNKANRIGSIDVGKNADLVIHNCPSHSFLTYHIAINHVATVIKNGRIIKDGR
jgi:imidazolonepropionase